MNRLFHIFKGRGRLDAAALRRVRVHDGRLAANSDEMRLWLRDEKNQRAYDQVEQVWTTLEDCAPAPEMLAIRREALTRVAKENRPFFRPFWIIAGLAAAAGLCIIGLVEIALPVQHANPSISVVYSTEAGKQRVVVLSDRSSVWLDSASSVRVQSFDQHVRKLWLIKGRARFDVAHDKTRPFEVTAGNETTVAVGTSFDVEQLNAKFLVTVREGRVRINTPFQGPRPPPPVFLAAGQRLTTEGGHHAVTSVDLLAENAWVQGKIVLNDERLDDAVSRINRYLGQPLLVSPEIAGLRVSGVFNDGDSHSFVSALTSYFPIQSRTSESGQILLEKRI